MSSRLNPLLILAIVAAALVSVAAGKVWLPWSAWTFEDPRWLIIAELRLPSGGHVPEGLLTPLSKTELVNLITYLRSPSQVPLPGEKK